MQKTKYAYSINARKRARAGGRGRMGTEEQTVTNPITSIRSSTNSQFTRMGEYPVRPAAVAWRARGES